MLHDNEIEALVRDKYRKATIKPSEKIILEEIAELKQLRNEKNKPYNVVTTKSKKSDSYPATFEGLMQYGKDNGLE